MDDDLRERVARAIEDASDWLYEEEELYSMADAALAEIGGVRVPSRAKLIALAACAKHSQACDGGYGIVGIPAAEAAVDAILEAIEPAPISVREAARVLLGHTTKITAKPLAEMSEAMKIDAHPAILLRGFCAALRAIAEGKDDDRS